MDLGHVCKYRWQGNAGKITKAAGHFYVITGGERLEASGRERASTLERGGS